MKEVATAYYARLAEGYAGKIRQLVPRYDDMVGCIAGLLRWCGPATILDVGPGVGSLAHRILQDLPRARVTAVEASEEMAAAARQHLDAYAHRATILQQDILDFAPEEPFDAVVSNLVLHNLPPAKKRELLKRIVDWLRPGGVFVWGDLIRHVDPGIQEHFVRQRMDFARAAGCPGDLVAENFEKEARSDYPLAVEETLHLARSVGFCDPQVVWAHDTFAVFFMRAASSEPPASARR